MAGLSARDYGGGLSTNGWEKRGTQDVSLTKDDGFDEEVAQAAGITDEDPNKEALQQRAKEGRARANELAEFAKLQESQKKEAASKAGLASLVAERAAAKNTKRELPSFLKVGGCSARTIGAFFGKVPCLAVTALLGIAVLLATQGQKARRRLTRKRSATSRHDPG
ncbi:unnamed protein product [Symbiodinium pilosum]|uniref:Uncharacterized protein n=1 Tax=Symbiodinium pilosum TaxID=2952 RepID=A0A812VQM0_SYMPI|nr:unnamed protein product [Symbiodinium pilosum]